mmetsp:Transcript_54695/g.138117  ORF Transcript_54695/g.138117 Transcript_54695/m.138117 type:complete len:93 (+) Transcript_54695:740-1018(+)
MNGFWRRFLRSQPERLGSLLHPAAQRMAMPQTAPATAAAVRAARPPAMQHHHRLRPTTQLQQQQQQQPRPQHRPNHSGEHPEGNNPARTPIF